jgi:Secretion system C-terminal sorting domain
MYVLNQDTIWLIDDEPMTSGVFRTTNGGLTWTRQLSAGSQNPDMIYMYNARIGFIVDNTGGNNLRKTTDGGNSWFTVVSGQGFYDMKFIDSLTGWRAKDYIKKTTDGGLTWVEQTFPQGGNGYTLFPSIRSFSVLNKDSIWGGYGVARYPNLFSRGILLQTTNGGTSWRYQIPDTSFQIPRYNHVQFLNAKTGWAYFLGSGIHTTTGGDTTFYTTSIQTNTEVPKDYILYQNYPNPFNPKTTIEYEIKHSGYITLAVYDIRGKEMTTLVSQKQTPGKYLVDFPGVLFPSGVYFYRLSTDGKPIDTKKMMLIK